MLDLPSNTNSWKSGITTVKERHIPHPFIKEHEYRERRAYELWENNEDRKINLHIREQWLDMKYESILKVNFTLGELKDCSLA